MEECSVDAEIQQEICAKWAIPSLKTHQKLALWAVVVAEQDCIVCVPTGGGKSLCFEAITHVGEFVNAGLQNQIVLVISPLVFLMNSQAEKMNNSLRIRAVSLASVSENEMDRLRRGEYRCVFTFNSAFSLISGILFYKFS